MLNFNFDKFIPSKKEDELDSIEIEKKIEDERQNAWDSLDLGYRETSNEEQIEANNEPGGQMGQLMEKYELEEWELKDQANECLKYYRGEREKVYKDEEKIKEVLNWYLDYLSTENEYGLALNETELSRLNEAEKKDLFNLYKERSDLYLNTDRLNDDIREVADIIRSGKTANIYSTQVSDAKNKLNNLKKEAGSLYQQMQNNLQKINSLEEKAFTDPAIKAKEEEMIEAEHEKQKEEREFEKEKSKKPLYTPAERQLHADCLNYLTRGTRVEKEEPVYEGGKLNLKQIERMAKEGAVERIKRGEMQKAKFFVEEFKGKKQLAHVKIFYDKENKRMKRIKYICVDDNLPAGNYGFKINPATMFVSKKNPDSAMIYINLMVNIDKKNKKRDKISA